MSEETLDIPMERLNPDTLQKMIEEFVTREWSESADSEYTLEEKVAQVYQHLHEKRARIVYDPESESWNIIPAVKNGGNLLSRHPLPVRMRC